MPKKKETLYIAYGSNMNLDQMEERCPNSNVIANGTLHGWRLRFYGRPDMAVATIEKCEGSTVPVLVWKINQQDEAALDIYEGWPGLYRKEVIDVDIDGKLYPALVYIMNKNPRYKYNRPSPYYVRVIASGYKTCGYDLNILYDAVRNNLK